MFKKEDGFGTAKWISEVSIQCLLIDGKDRRIGYVEANRTKGGWWDEPSLPGHDRTLLGP